MELKGQRQGAAALAALLKESYAQLRSARNLFLGADMGKPPTFAHWRTLGTHLARCGSLPMLQKLDIRRSVIGDEGVALLADGLRRGRLPSLRDLRLVFAKIGHRFSPSRLSLPPAAALVIVRIAFALRRALDRCY